MPAHKPNKRDAYEWLESDASQEELEELRGHAVVVLRIKYGVRDDKPKREYRRKSAEGAPPLEAQHGRIRAYLET